MTRSTYARPLLAGTVLAACLLAAGCSSSKGAPASPPAGSTAGSAASAAGSSSSKPTPATAITITIKDFGYTVSGSATTGSAVQVTNGDAQAHTVTADSGNSFDVTIEPGKTATLTAPSAAGAYKFHCTFHSNMHGTLTVTE
jgi:plastocyanin